MLKKRATIPAGKQQHRVESMAQSIYVGAWVPAFRGEAGAGRTGCRTGRAVAGGFGVSSVGEGRGSGEGWGTGGGVTADGSNFRPSVSAYLRSAAYLSSSGEPIHHHAGRGHRAASVKTEDGIRVKRRPDSPGVRRRDRREDDVDLVVSQYIENLRGAFLADTFVADDAFHAALRVLRGRRRLPTLSLTASTTRKRSPLLKIPDEFRALGAVA